MRTILNTLSNLVDNSVLITSSVLNYYNSGSYEQLLKNTRSNLHSDVVRLIKKGNANFGITVTEGAKGRSQHSATQLIVFKGEVNGYLGTYFTFDELLSLTNQSGN